MPDPIVITWALVRNICGGIDAGVYFLAFVGTGAVWALEQHFDDRYVIVANTLKGELRKIERELRYLRENGGSEADIEFLERQRDDILDDIENS